MSTTSSPFASIATITSARLGNPAAGEDVLANEELGVAPSDVPDEVKHPEAPGLQAIGVSLDDFVELVAPRVLQHADRHDLVELALLLAEIRFDDVDARAETLAPDLLAHRGDLLGRGVGARDLHAVARRDVEHEAAESAPDVDDGLAFAQAAACGKRARSC